MVRLSENKLFEAIVNLVLQSISVWEDVHLYALTYSTEYSTFWGLLDDSMKTTACRYRTQNRQERRVPFTMSLFVYYKAIMTKESFEGITGQYWKKQIKLILADKKFRTVMAGLNLEIQDRYKSDYRNHEHRTDVETGSQRFVTRVG